LIAIFFFKREGETAQKTTIALHHAESVAHTN
jgi:hypothetical protein